MPVSYSPAKRRRAYSIVRRSNARPRRRNLPFQIRRGSAGRFTEKGGALIARFPKTARSRTKSGKRRKSSPATTQVILAGFPGGGGGKKRKNSGKKSSKRRKNPYRSRRRARRSNPFRIRRRRRNPGVVVYRRRGRRHNPGLGTITQPLSALWDLRTWTLAAEGLGGLSVSLSVPKLLAKATGVDGFQRGFGGVATAFVSTAATSGLVSAVTRGRLGRGIFVGGLIGSSLLLVSALSTKVREQLFPVEEALLAAALPTMPAKKGTADWYSAKAQAVYDNLISQGQSPQVAMQALKQLGLADYITVGRRKGAQDYYAPARPALPPVGAGYFQKSERF
jgi:hypothetical protein